MKEVPNNKVAFPVKAPGIIEDISTPNPPKADRAVNPPTPLTTEARIREQIITITKARDNTRMQLNGLENQLYILDQVLNPVPPLPEATEAPEAPPQGVPMFKGTI